jgi:hypothetical protein
METNVPVRKPALDERASKRLIADLYCIWRLCGRAECRRARTCRGTPEDCLGRCMPLVPEDARMWVVALMQGKELGETFEQAQAAMPPELNEAFDAWRAAVLGNGRASAPREGSPLPGP